MRHKCQEDGCGRTATQRLVVRIEGLRPKKYWYHAAAYCSEHAADIVNEIAHGEPPEATLVSVVALVQTHQDGGTK